MLLFSFPTSFQTLLSRGGGVVAALTIVLVALVVCWLAQSLLLVRVQKRLLTTCDTERENNRSRQRRRKRPPAFEDGELIPPLRRTGEIVVPEWSDDTRECDDFANARECDVSEGYRACFECIESRETLRVCAHVDEAVTVVSGGGGGGETTTVVLPPNTSSSKGYCVSEALAAQLRHLSDPDDDGGNNSGAARARRACRATNADWIFVRQRASADAVDSSFNFACRCKYPHLMANVAGPMSACSRAVGCNGHGRLDEDSRASRIDPFVDGRCECEAGWISEYDGSAGLGPYCREATVGEWPSLVPVNNDTGPYLDLFSEFVDAKFRASLVRQRLDHNADDDDAPEVLLKDPCYPCPIVPTDDHRAYFCGDELTVSPGRDGLFHIL